MHPVEVFMALNLKPDCRRRLIEVTREALEPVFVDGGGFVGYQSFGDLAPADAALESAGRVRPDLLKYIGDQPFHQFIQETLAKEFSQRGYNENIPACRLIEIPGYQDLGALSARLVGEFDSLPDRCLFSMHMPQGLKDLFEARTLFSDNLRIINATEFHGSGPNRERLNALATLLLQPQSGQLLQLECAGFLGRFWGSATEDDALSLIKSLFGMLAALGLVHFGMTPMTMTVGATLDAHEFKGGDWSRTRTIELPRAMASTLAKLRPVRGAQDMTMEVAGRLRFVFGNIERYRKLLLAAEWLFNSFDDSDELLSYVQAMVVLEILLGDKAKSDVVGVGELLRNRCAYLIGRTHTERTNIIERFNDIYSVRSHIVHAGKTRLNRKERMLFHILHSYCRRVIQAELELFEHDTTAQPTNAIARAVAKWAPGGLGAG
jgi:hypothetical protein